MNNFKLMFNVLKIQKMEENFSKYVNFVADFFTFEESI